MEQQKQTEINVLVVDADPVYAEFVIGALRRAGLVGHHVASGENAVEVAATLEPAAVILDVILPGRTGYDICRELRQRYGEELPIVFVSGERREAADRVVGLLIGADDYLVKPVDAEELIARLRRLIAKSRGFHGLASRRVSGVHGADAARERGSPPTGAWSRSGGTLPTSLRSVPRPSARTSSAS